MSVLDPTTRLLMVAETLDSHAEIAARSGQMEDLEANAEVLREIAAQLKAAAPIDWPARFRAAARVVRDKDGNWAYYALGDLEQAALAMSPDAVEAIGRALLGETTTP